jgi:hypothetical protein
MKITVSRWLANPMGQIKKIIKSACKRGLALVGVEVRRARGHDWTDVASFIPFEPTLKAAAAAGLSVGDYIDSVMNKIPGATQATCRPLGAWLRRRLPCWPSLPACLCPG